MTSFMARLDEATARMERSVDPWALRLERVRGTVGDDGIERITTQNVFDILEVPQGDRGAGACRRLARLMSEHGWMPIRLRGLTRGAYLEQVRGYARDARSRSN
jgi:hypothetical protein